MRTRLLHVVVVLALVGGMGVALGGPGRGAVAQDNGQGQGAGLADYPPSVTIGDQQFLVDRLVPLDRGDLVRVERQGRVTYYARTDAGPYDAVYGLLPGRSREGMVRYWPTRAEDPTAACPSEGANVGPLTAGEQTFAFANVETDITTDALTQLPTGADQEV